MTGLRARMLALIRSRILGALAEYDQVPTDDPIWMQESQERTDAIMAALFARRRRKDTR